MLWIFYSGNRANRVVGPSGGWNVVMLVFHDPTKFGNVEEWKRIGANSMGANSRAFPVRHYHVGHRIHMDDGINGVYSFIREVVLARERSDAG